MVSVWYVWMIGVSHNYCADGYTRREWRDKFFICVRVRAPPLVVRDKRLG